MTIDPGKEIRSLFAKAALEHEAAKNLNGDEWAAYREIQEAHAAQVRREERLYRAEYKTRLETARKRIIDQAGIKTAKLLPRWLGGDGFDSAAIDRQADRNVRHAHERLLSRLDQGKEAALKPLFRGSERREGLRSTARDAFTQAADRRAGQERRRSPPR